MSFSEIAEISDRELIYPEFDIEPQRSKLDHYIRLFYINKDTQGSFGVRNALSLSYLSNSGNMDLIHEITGLLIRTSIKSVEKGKEHGVHETREFDGRFLNYEDFPTDENDADVDREALWELIKNLCVSDMVDGQFLLYHFTEIYIDYNRKSRNHEIFEHGDLVFTYKNETPMLNSETNPTITMTRHYNGQLKERRVYNFRENRFKLLRDNIPKTQIESDEFASSNSYIVWDTENVPAKKTRAYFRDPERISALSAWMFYDKHKIFGKHAYLDLLCTRVSYIAILKSKKDENDNIDDTYVDFKPDPIASSILIGVKKRANMSLQNRKKENETLKGLGSACLNMMLIESFNKGYERVVLTVVKDKKVESVAHATLRWYKKMGFSIIGELSETFFIDEKSTGTNVYYVMVKIMRKSDYDRIIEDMLHFIDFNDALKLSPELSNLFEKDVEEEEEEEGESEEEDTGTQ